MKKILLLAGVAGLVASNANAVELTPYVGADYNYSFVDTDHDADGVISGHSHSGALVLGTKVTPYAGLEAFGEYSKKEHKLGVRSKIYDYGLDLMGYIPLGCYGEWEVIGTTGMGWYTIKAQGYGEKEKDRGWGYRLGAGLQYNMTENWSVRGMYRHVWVDKSYLDAIDEISLGVRYHF